MPPAGSSPARWAILTAVLALLNGSLTFVNVWPTPRIAWSAQLSVELACVVLALAVQPRWAARVSRVILPAIWLALVIGRYADVTAPALYGRPFNLYWDVRHLSNVTGMLGHDVPWWIVGAVAVGLIVLVAGAFLAGRLAFQTLARSIVEVPRVRAVLAGLSVIALVLFARELLVAPPLNARVFAAPVTPSYVRQARTLLATSGATSMSRRLAPSPDALSLPLDGLHGADVLLLFLESYGAVTYDDPELAPLLAEARASLEATARETGRAIVTARVGSPTFGGSSWLAHLTLLTGLDIRDPYAYASVMTQPRDTLVTAFKRQGYRTIGLMPGMRQAWPEGAFYGYDVMYGRTALEYPGPQFGWWGIPDQYSLAKLDAMERWLKQRAPIFVVFPTSTTHAPFGPVPPYQPDWLRTLTARPYDDTAIEASWTTIPDLTNLRPSYVRATQYMLETLAGFLRSDPDSEMILLLVGDHQPPAAVTGLDASWDVPVHIIAGARSGVIPRLHQSGFQPGVALPPRALGQMHELVPILMRAFSTR